MIKKSIRCLGLCPALTGLRNLRLRISAEIPRQNHQSLCQPLISKSSLPKFLFGPIGWRPDGISLRRRHSFAFTQPLTGITVQRIEQHLFDGQRLLIILILAPASFGFSCRDPIASLIACASESLFFNECFHQKRIFTVSVHPVGSNAPQRHPQHMRGQIGHLQARHNEESAIGNDA